MKIPDKAPRLELPFCIVDSHGLADLIDYWKPLHFDEGRNGETPRSSAVR